MLIALARIRSLPSSMSMQKMGNQFLLAGSCLSRNCLQGFVVRQNPRQLPKFSHPRHHYCSPLT